MLHSGDDVLYNMGCQNNQLCSSSVDPIGIIGRSIQSRQQYSCHECCSNYRCNDQLCKHRKQTSCIDDATLDCARLNSIINVCADVHHAKTICPKFCGLCQLVDGNWGDWGSGLRAAFRVVTERKHAHVPARTRLLPTVDSTAPGLMLSQKYVRTNYVRYTEIGQIGPCGQVAQLLVVWEYEKRQERARILHQTGLGTIVSVNRANIQCVQMNPATSLMVAGRAGVCGRDVLSHVEWV
ncbi:uncharacterized protein LOC127847694 isoform X2 [Dreissena polymorpha]|nr:uncharacterized protein LOC127847694 isoform X2 [Dreissena polymorpha]XP_052235725.1 uncharacterized protein LOC127847694 isoform X2 [Dreissena polymorpha]XP_052235726.1 uncharacterized protein LOC127847694 isoform X2 [Dreissena polymorpha]XP_052235727.1 uncharacterized protein LOC127847694 isoform X2 [Dreissena polymorpha]